MHSINCGNFTISFDRTRIAGILNITPDSFSDGGKFFTPTDAIAHARALVAAGADVIDIGGESSRPGSPRISADEELRRITPVLDVLTKELQIPISIDTMKPKVADECLRRGAHIINDVSGLRDPAMREVIARHKASVIIMHMQGTPDIMQKNPQYENVVEEIITYLDQQATLAREAGIEQVIIDPGIGFGKTIQHNLAILAHLGEFRRLGYPVMIGVSRKSFLQKIVGMDASAASVASATLAAEAIARYSGVDFIRTHDVAAALRAIAIAEAIQKAV